MIPITYGPRIQQFAMRPPEQDLRVNILVGSVRSGKTWGLQPKIWYGSADYNVGGWKVITGASKDMVYKNVLNDLFENLGPRRYHYNHQSGHLRIGNSNWVVLGASDQGAEKYLRGMTIGYAICDELTQMPKSFFQMLLTRMSPPGARLYATTNTDSPLHWLKKEYLDREHIAQPEGLRGLLWSMTCTMDDNPSLTEEYKNSQKALYRGLFYERFILGRWVLAEGGIFKDVWNDELKFNDVTMPITLKNAGGYIDRWISVDAGVDHPQVYLEYYDDGEIIWVTNEFYWDSKVEQKQLTDAQYADKLIEFMGKGNACQIIIPPEALSFKTECTSRGLWVTNANNQVLEGIQTVCALMNRRKLRIHEKCTNLLREISTYCWDPKASARGVEQPLKVDDDAIDSGRYGLHGKIPRWRIAA